MRDEPRSGPLSWLTNRTLESVDVDELIAGVDVDAVVQRVDVNALVERIDPAALLDRVDPNALLDRVEPDRLLDRVDPNALLDRVDADRLLDRVDPNALLDRVEPDRLLDRVDPNALLDRVDADRLLDRVNPDRLLDRVDPNRLLDRVEPDRLLDRVDADRLLDRVDPNRLLDRVDPNRLLARVDPDALMDRVDVNRLMARVDVVDLVDRAGVADIVADSTGAVAGSVLDTARRQIVALDTIIERALYRVTGRDPHQRPVAPAAVPPPPGAVAGGRGQVTGTYAGPLSRLLAFLIDAVVVFWVFTIVSAGIAWVLGRLGVQFPADGQWTVIGALSFALWCFTYWLIALGLTGRTVGKGIVGLKVLARSGAPVTGGRAAARTIVEPVSIVTLVGLLSALFTPRRTTLHDAVAGTCEVYDWGDRPAELPAPLTAWIEKRAPQALPGTDPLRS